MRDYGEPSQQINYAKILGWEEVKEVSRELAAS